MEEVCDICGKKNIPGSNYCSLCGVDLREDKSVIPGISKNRKPTKKQKNEKKNTDDKKIKWCEIYALMHSFEMTLPTFIFLNVIFADGNTELGFCNCSVCNLGFRELHSKILNNSGNKNLKPSSREVVIKARETDIPSIRFNISEFVTRVSKSDNTDESLLERTEKSNKISIEIDAHVLEGVVFHILSSEKGRALMRKYSESDS